MVLGDHVEDLRQGTVVDKACTLLYADHMPRAIKVRSQKARIRTSCRSRVPGEDLELVGLSPAALIRTKTRTRRKTIRLFQEFGSQFPISVKVRNESGMSACRTRQLGAPGVAPVTVIFSETRETVVNTKTQRAVDWVEASKRAVGIPGRRRLKTWRQADSWGGRHREIVNLKTPTEWEHDG